MITNTDIKDTATGNGSLTVYTYTFQINDESEMVVKVDGVLQTIVTDYSVQGVGNALGGTVTFVVAPPNGDSVFMKRFGANTQSIDLISNDSIPADTLEGALDKLTMRLQEQEEADSRTPSLDVESVETIFDIGALNANAIMKLNAAKTLAEMKGLLYAVKTSQQSVTNSTTLEDVTDFSFTVLANKKYVIDMGLMVFAQFSGVDFRYKFVTPSGTFNLATEAGFAIDETDGEQVKTLASSVETGMTFHGGISVGGSGGTFKLQMAQGTSSATAVLLKVNSYMRLLEV